MNCPHFFKKAACFGLIFCALLLSAAGSRAEQSKVNGVSEDENGAYYTIQKGDTLWSISQKFKGSAWKWQDIWNLNKDKVSDPKKIYPGQKLRMPANGTAAASPPPSAPAPLAAPALAPAPLSPPPAVPAGVSDTRTPVTAPMSADVSAPQAFAGGDIDNSPFFSYTPIARVGFLRKEPIQPAGIIFKVKIEKSMISTDDIVFVKTNEELELGKSYTIYRDSRPLIEKKTRKLIGTQYLVTGLLEVVERKEGYSLARITQAFREIFINDKIAPFPGRSPKLKLQPGKAGLRGKIITSEEQSYMFGEHDIVFLDKGENDGMARGQQYSIYFEDTLIIDGQRQTLPVEVGRLLVLLAMPESSSALVVQSDKTLRPGMGFKGPDF